MTIGLGIDTSFDDTAIAVVRDGTDILSNLCVSQFEQHEEFGGVLPERASRLHMELIHPLVRRALEETGLTLGDIDYVAATNRPGLVGSLLVGVTVAKGLALALDRPLIGVNHLEAHVHAAFLDHPDLKFPFVSLLISGANTLVFHHRGHHDFDVMGGTTDDAVGECIDKVGRFLGLDMPAGPALQALALEGDPRAIRLPRPMLHSDDYNFSFSGLKTAVVYRMRDDATLSRADMAAALLAATAEVLVKKTMRAAKEKNVPAVVLCGGAAANLQIREAFAAAGEEDGIRPLWPGIPLCTDNAAMVAALGHQLFIGGHRDDLDLDVRANVSWKESAG